MLPEDPAERHRAIAATFSERVAGVTDWSAPAPVEGWTAADVVNHLVTWLPGFLAAGSEHAWPPGPSAYDDPQAAWAAQVAGVQGLLEDPAAAASPFTHPHTPPGWTLTEAITNFYTADVFMHTWDLAQASGQEHGLDQDVAAGMLAGMRPIEDMLRGSGQYGPAVPVDESAPPVEQLMGFVGRDPGWQGEAHGTSRPPQAEA